MNQMDKRIPKKGSGKVRVFFFLVFMTSIILAGLLYSTSENSVLIKYIQEPVRNAGVWAPILFIFLYIFATIFIPSTPLMVLSGILFGFKYGFLYSLVGGMISALILFLLTRKLGSEFAEKILYHERFKKINAYNKKIKNDGIFELIILRIIPIMPFNVLTIVMGLSSIKVRNFILGTVIGLIPSHIATVYAGSFFTKIF